MKRSPLNQKSYFYAEKILISNFANSQTRFRAILIKLYEIFSRMCQDCRNDQYEDLDGLFAQAEANYSKVVEAIKKI